MKPLETPVLPSGIRSRFVDEINGLKVHILEAGFDAPGRQLVLMLHGFLQQIKRVRIRSRISGFSSGKAA